MYKSGSVHEKTCGTSPPRFPRGSNEVKIRGLWCCLAPIIPSSTSPRNESTSYHIPGACSADARDEQPASPRFFPVFIRHSNLLFLESKTPPHEAPRRVPEYCQREVGMMIRDDA